MDLPLKSMVFCCTSVEADLRSSIAANIEAMGGQHRTDLMSDVTFLIVGSRDTPKYEFAVKHRADMTFLRPSFILELGERWKSGEDFDITEEIERGKLQVFENLIVSCTNIQPEPDRKIFIDIVQSQGGTYSPDLTRQVTHLVSPSSTGRKYIYAKKWGIAIVDPLWVTKSVERGAALDTQYFSLDLPQDLRGKAAFVEPVEIKRAPVIKLTTATAKPVLKKKSGKVWDSILQGIEKSDIPPSRDSVSAWADEKRYDNSLDLEPMEDHSRTSGNDTAKPGLFSGYTFVYYGFSDKQITMLTNAVTSHGGSLKPWSNYCTPDDSCTKYLVYSEMDPKELPGKLSSSASVITEWAIERSLYKKRTILDDNWCHFLPHHHLHDLHGIDISISGFSGIELLHLEKLIKILGATYQPVIIPQRDLLIATKGAQKFKFAMKYGIPIVNEKWLFECAKLGRAVGLTSPEWVMDGKEAPDRVLKSPVGLRRRPDAGNPKRTNDSISGGSSILPNPIMDMLSSASSELEDRKRGQPDVLLDSMDEPRKERRLVGRAAISKVDKISTVGGLIRRMATAESGSTSSIDKPDAGDGGDDVMVSYVDAETQKQRKKVLAVLGEYSATPLPMPQDDVMSPAVDLVRRDRRERVRAGHD